MTPVPVPWTFDVPPLTVDVLQELQIILSLENHTTYGEALEATLEWYDETIKRGNVLRFSPPPDQPGWKGYVRSLEIDREPATAADGSPPTPQAEEEEDQLVRVEGAARERLTRSEDLLALTTRNGLERMVRLMAEHEFRLRDRWTVEIDTDKEVAS